MAAAHVASRHSRFAAPRPAVPYAPASGSLPDLDLDPGDDPPAPSALVFETTEIQLGRLARGEGRRVEVRWRRTGPGALRVLQVVPGCGCVVAHGLEETLERTLQAGATGTVVLEVAGRARRGPFAETVRVLTDRPSDDVVTLRVRGFVGDGAVVSPSAISLGPAHPGERFVRWLTVRAEPGRAPPPVDVKLDGLSGTVRGLPPRREGAVGWDLEVTLRAPPQVGPFSGSLGVRVGDAAPVHVPVDGIVRGVP